MLSVTQDFFKGKGLWLPSKQWCLLLVYPPPADLCHGACLACVSALRDPVVGMEVPFLGPWGARSWLGSLPKPVGVLLGAITDASSDCVCQPGVCLGVSMQAPFLQEDGRRGLLAASA